VSKHAGPLRTRKGTIMNRKVASLPVLAAASALVLGACSSGSGSQGGGGSSSAATKTAAIQTAPSEVTVAFADKMSSLDPDLAVNVQEINAEGLIGEGLYEFRYGTASTPEPGLAQSASVSANRRTWTFTLRPGLKFSDGTRLTASDVAATLNRDISNKANIWANFTAPMKSASAPNPTTVVLSLKAPYPNIKTILAESGFAVLPASAYRRASSSSYWDHPISAGPYVMQSWNGGNTSVMVANPDYWGPKPVIREVRFTTIPESNTTEAELETGEIDMADQLPMSTEPQLEARKGIIWKLQQIYGIYGFALNDDAAPFNNVNVRKAVNDAIDRQAMNRLLWRGYAKPISGFWPTTMTGYDPSQSTKQNLTGARALLKGTPCANGCHITITYDPSNGPWAELGSEIAANDLDAIGIHTTITEVNDTTWSNTVTSAKNYQMGFTYMYDFANVPNGMLEYDALPSSFFKAFYSNWKNPKLSGLIRKADESSGTAELGAIRQVNTMFEQDQPFVTVATWNDMWAQRVSNKFNDVEPTEQVEVARAS
jgi:peptide/nickel transport system substrate-binding protein